MPVPSTTISHPWRRPEKISFRFFFLLLAGSSIFSWGVIFYYATLRESNPTTPIYQFLTGPFYWLDKHLFHFGYDPKLHGPVPGDTHFGVVYLLSLLLLAIFGTMIWTLLDRKSQSYEKLLYWFRLYLRYVLAMVMFGYGISKLIPMQMPYPNAVLQLMPLGEMSRFRVLWTYMAIAPGYKMLTGSMEVLGSLLLLNRRTAVAGCLLLLIVLINVVAINIFYNVQVKLLSIQLLIYCLFLLSPYLNRLSRLFFFGQAVSLAEKHYRFQRSWKNILLAATVILIPLLHALPATISDYKNYRENLAGQHNERVYEITSFVTVDTLPPPDTDTFRWKRLIFAYTYFHPDVKQVVIYNMREEQDWYSNDTDSSKNTFTFYDGADSLHRHVFRYAYPAKDQLVLTGKWKGRDVNIGMRSISQKNLPLNTEKIKWIRD
jgi:hypothetical protein